MIDRPSATAVLVARAVATVYATPELRGLVPNGIGEMTEQILHRESMASRLYVRLLRYAWYRRFAFRVEASITPGIFLHFALRKRFIEDAVRRSIADGARQVVILGAGLDTLAPRLSKEFGDVAFLEVDHPASQAAKLSLLPAEASAGDNLHFCPLDMALPGLPANLQACPGFHLGERTVFVAEGLLMYLPVEAVRTLFQAIRTAAPDCQVVFTAIDTGLTGKPELRRTGKIVYWWLARINEPFRWGIHPSDVDGFLREFGLRLDDTAGAKELRTRYLPTDLSDRNLAAGEYLYVASAAP